MSVKYVVNCMLGEIIMNKNETHDHSLPNQEKWIILSTKELKHLFLYYVFVLIVSLFWIIFSVLFHYEFSKNGFSNVVGIFMFAFPSGALGGVMYYIRKLYKSCIQNIIVETIEPSKNNTYIRKIGAKMYFYVRPIFSAILASLVNMGIIAGFYIINNNPSINNEKFFLFIIVLSFYIGFCNGKIFVKMDKQGESFAHLIVKEK